MCAATGSKRANPICIRNLPRLTFCDDEISARHGSPGDMRCAGAAPAIDAMTIDQSKRLALQQVSCSAANASTSDLHAIGLPRSMNQETRNSGSTFTQLPLL